MSEPLDLDAIKARADAATEGPWESVVDDHGRGRVDASIWAKSIGYYIAEKVTSGPKHIADAEFMAKAREDVPALVAELERTQRLLKVMNGMISEITAVCMATEQERDGLRDRVDDLERALDEEIKTRDEYHDAADRLAYTIAPVEVIGEHTSGNDPWANAAEVMCEIHHAMDQLKQYNGIGWHRATELSNLIDQVAIPSLRYCETKCGHDNQARLNLEAGTTEALCYGLPEEIAARVRASRADGPPAIVLDDATGGV
jgi:hypothetical protein